jgi:hypothetical protein
MKNLKVQMSMLALVLGIGTAFATVHPVGTGTKKWSRNHTSGVYTELPPSQSYSCLDASTICTATYPDDVNPNNQAGDAHPGIVQPTSFETGDFQ